MPTIKTPTCMGVTGAMVGDTQIIYGPGEEYEVRFKGIHMPGWNIYRKGKYIHIEYHSDMFKAIVYFKQKATTTLDVALIVSRHIQDMLL